jgi:lysozyme
VVYVSDDHRIDNLRAFLDAIATFESDKDDGYRMLYGGTQWTGSMRDHPANQGWPGIQLPDHLCQRAGFRPPCYSTAAGRYQILRPTWNRLRDTANLESFEPEFQDRCAVFLLGEADALQFIEAGLFDEAVMRARKVWASMPMAGYGQAEHSMDKWRDAYADAGGSFA